MTAVIRHQQHHDHGVYDRMRDLFRTIGLHCHHNQVATTNAKSLFPLVNEQTFLSAACTMTHWSSREEINNDHLGIQLYVVVSSE